MFEWIKGRIEERTSWNGFIIGGAAIIVILGLMPLTTVLIWGALAWGVYNIWKSE